MHGVFYGGPSGGCPETLDDVPTAADVVRTGACVPGTTVVLQLPGEASRLSTETS